jgi:Inner membrane protein YgaP-like, transmembrane domain
MNATFKFLASGTGRIVRIVVGAVLVVLGFFINPTWLGIVLVVVGLIPLLAGIFDVCVFAPLFGKPFNGKKLRAS